MAARTFADLTSSDEESREPPRNYYSFVGWSETNSLVCEATEAITRSKEVVRPSRKHAVQHEMMIVLTKPDMALFEIYLLVVLDLGRVPACWVSDSCPRLSLPPTRLGGETHCLVDSHDVIPAPPKVLR
jgi:hypothetical protein